MNNDKGAEVTDQPTVQRFDKITDGLAGLAVPVGELKQHPANYRKGDVELIAQSLVRFGQMKPVVVQESTGHIVAGNHTFKAATGLGWTHVAANIVDMDDETAKAYLLADNHLSDLAENDTAQIAALLQEQVNAGGQMSLVGTGYKETDVADLADLAHALTNEVNPEEPFSGDYADGHPKVNDVEVSSEEDGEKEKKQPMREVVLLLEVEDAALMGQRIRNLQKKWSDVGGITAALLRSVSFSHEILFGSADPAEAEGSEQSADEPAAENEEQVSPEPEAQQQETFDAQGPAPTTEPLELPGE